jgi:hypothetical protein
VSGVRHASLALVDAVMAGWNWKAALFSSLFRAAVFFGANLPAGLAAAIAASRTEFLYRGLAAGFYGALTARFSRVQPRALGTLGALIVLPLLAHAVEYAVHHWAGTANLGVSVLASVAFSAGTTSFNLFAMRRGLLLAGRGRPSLAADLRALARLVADFADGKRRGGRALSPSEGVPS